MKRLIPSALALLAIVAFLLLLTTRQKTAPQPAQADTSAPRAAVLPDAQVLLRMTAFQVTEPAASSDSGKRVLDLLTPTTGRGGTLTADAATAARSAIDTLGPGGATIVAAPSIMTLAAQPARVLIENLAVTGDRRDIEIDITPTPRADGSIDLPIELLRKDVAGAVPLFLDDLGLPIGERRAEADLSIPAGSRGFLVRRLRDGSVLIVFIEPSVIDPTPPAARGD